MRVGDEVAQGCRLGHVRCERSVTVTQRGREPRELASRDLSFTLICSVSPFGGGMVIHCLEVVFQVAEQEYSLTDLLLV